MALTSTLSAQRSFLYDVFLSFRGEDVRKSFVDHLYKALNDKGIIIYKDDKRIVKGEEISDQLIAAIKNSKFHIIVFSKNYANSAWCLEELVQIMECQETGEQTAYPIFYDVQPTQVRNQSGPVGVAFEKHIKKEAVGGWRNFLKIVACQDCSRLNTSAGEAGNGATRRWKHALTQASNLAGRELKHTADGHEVPFIKKVVEDILQSPHFTNFSTDADLVGMAIRIQKLLSSLHVDSDDVRVIGIKGMGGGGKTTLARAVFDHISSRFEGKSFVENVRERSKVGSSLHKLQKQILSSVFNDHSIFIEGVSDGKRLMKRMMPGRTALIVLDDVDHIEQLEALVGDSTCFKHRSRIIITTRDEQVLVGYGVQRDNIYDVDMLSDEEAINLLSRHAFKTESPIQGFEDLSKRVVSYAAGLPLTIKLLGSFLCGRPQDEWKDTIKRLKTIPWHDTLKRLEISYDGLEEDHKQIFLHVACLLKGQKESEAIIMLESCGFHARIGLKVLEQKSLITVRDSKRYVFGKEVTMHDHIEELGGNIVRRLCPDEPNKHMILWKKDEIEHILINESGTEAIWSIKLENTDLHAAKILQGLRKMRNLRFLYISESYTKYKFNEAGGYLPNSLRHLDWEHYPFQHLPKIFQADNLVHLCMQQSNIYQLWEGGEKKVFLKLKFLDLSLSNMKTFDLEMTPNLEELVLPNCNKLVEVNMDVECPHLKVLNLALCRALEKLNSSNKCLNLQKVNLDYCRNFKELPRYVEFPKLESLYFSSSGVTNLNLGLTPNLKHLYLKDCRDLVELHVPVHCPNLITLELGGFKVNEYFKSDLASIFEKLESLKWLALWSIDIECLPYSICMLKHLTYLQIRYCSHLKQLPEDFGRLRCLTTLDLKGCSSLQDIPTDIYKIESLVKLNLKGCKGLKKLSDDIGRLQCLETLTLGGCSSLQDIPNSICKLESLEFLNLIDCEGIKKLPDEFGRLENLKWLGVTRGGIENLSQSISQLKGLLVSS
uniref:disease resistance protein Roq1-like n=1 Tax=Erigeron canadensis TaxID=72917 RepID=UPI001CB9B661|nr:disease resistance protein Roq1-like [Erigeron canadensis]